MFEYSLGVRMKHSILIHDNQFNALFRMLSFECFACFCKRIRLRDQGPDVNLIPSKQIYSIFEATWSIPDSP